MTQKERNPFSLEIDLPMASTAALQGRQSVRATFKLSAECIDALNIVATHMGIRQKALFDHLAEDRNLLHSIARELKGQPWGDQPSVQKTYVISRHTLSVLNRIAKKRDISRNALIELSVRRLMPIIAQQQQDYAERKKVLDQLKHHLAAGEKLKSRIDKLFGRDDVLRAEFTHVMESYANCVGNLERFMERGKMIEDFEFSIQS
jgi:predicted DNA-binding protein YlxM (UPF0122 family)